MCHLAEFGRSSSNDTIVIKKIGLTIRPLASRLSRSLNVIGTDTDRYAAYGFLSMFRSNHGPISYTVSEINGEFNRKSQIFPLPVYFASSLKGLPWNLVPVLGIKN